MEGKSRGKFIYLFQKSLCMRMLSLIVILSHLLSLQECSAQPDTGSLERKAADIHNGRQWRSFLITNRPTISFLKDYPVLFPLDRRRIPYFKVSSSFGMRFHPVKKRRILHAGTDFAVPCGTPVYAAGDGRVTFSGYGKGYGWYIIISHKEGFSTLYAHLSRKYVRKDDRVVIGSRIGDVGNSGVATGCHLHFELRKNGVPQDPLQWLPCKMY